jgi:O-antigen/teichoic acid export membrane protein
MSLATTEDDTEAMNLFLLCFLVIAGWTAVAAVATFSAPQAVTDLLSKDDTQFLRYIWFLPLGICFTAIMQTFKRWTMRERDFPRLSKVQVVQGLVASVCTVTLGFLHAGLPGLIVGSLASTLYGIWAYGRHCYPKFHALWPGLSLAGMAAAARRFYRYPLYTTWSTLLGTFSGMVPVFMLAKGFGNTYTGYFALTQRILYLPIVLVSGAITPVFYSRAKQAQLDGPLARLTTRLVDSIAGINVFFSVFIGLFGEWLFVLVFGSQWHRAGQYAAALAPWVLCYFLVSPLEALPLIYDRQRTAFVFQAVLLFVRIGSLLIGIHYHNDLLAMWLFGGSSAVYMLAYFGWLLHLVDGPVAQSLGRLGRELAFALVVFGACRLLLGAVHYRPWVLVVTLVPLLCYFSFRGTRQLLLGRVQA